MGRSFLYVFKVLEVLAMKVHHIGSKLNAT